MEDEQLPHIPIRVLEEHVVPHLELVPDLFKLDNSSFCEVDKHFNRLLMPLIPRQTELCLLASQEITIKPAPSRMSHSHPRQPSSDESELTLQFWHRQGLDLCHVAHGIRLIAQKQQKQVRILKLLGIHRDLDRDVVSLLYSLPLSIALSLHTLCVSLVFWRSRRLLELPFSIFPNITTLNLEYVTMDLNVLATALTGLKSLQARKCTINNWPSLPLMTTLQQLRINSFDCVPRAALVAIEQLPWLSCVGLHPIQDCSAISTFTGLTTLALGCLRIDDTDVFQTGLQLVAASSPGVRVISLLVPRGITIPGDWDQLEEVIVSYNTVIPQLATITRVVILKLMAYDEQEPLQQLPNNLLRLDAPSDALQSALHCHGLKELICRTATCTFRPSDHAPLLSAIQTRGNIWPAVTSVYLLNEVDHTKIESQQQNTFHLQLISALAGRPKESSAITHMTVQQSLLGAVAVEALCQMKLHTLTLIQTAVDLLQLSTLLAVPSMKVLELVHVTGITLDETVTLMFQAVSTGKLVVKPEMKDLRVNEWCQIEYYWDRVGL